MKRIIIAAAGLFVVMIILVAMLPLWFSADTIKQRILDETKMLLGHELSFRGNPSVSFSPFLGIEILDVVIKDPLAEAEGRPILQMERMQAKLELFSAFFGQAEINDYKFFRPQFNFKQYATGQANWNLESGALHDIIEANQPVSEATEDELQKKDSQKGAYLGRFEIVDGTLDYVDEIAGTAHSATNINGFVSWPQTSSDLEINIQTIWRGEQIALKATFADFLSLFSQEAIATSFAMVSAPMSVQFNGMSDIIAGIHLAGEMSVNSPSFNRLSKFIGVSVFDDLFFGELDVTGNFDGTAQKAAMSNATVTIGGNESTGALSWSQGEADNPKLDGTLAFSIINLEELVQALADYIPESDDSENSNKPDPLVLDLRLSANTLQFGAHSATEFAGTLSSKKGVWFLDVGNMSIFSGSLIAKVEADFNDLSPAFKMNASGHTIDLASISSLLGPTLLQPSGPSKIRIDATTSGNAIRDLAQNLDGNAELEAINAAFSGVDIAAVYNVLNDNKYRMSLDEIRGTSQIDKLYLKFAIDDGIAWTNQSEITTPQHKLKFFGNADVLRGGLAFRAEVEKNTSEQENVNEPKETRSLFVGGTVSAPLLTRWRLGRDNTLNK